MNGGGGVRRSGVGRGREMEVGWGWTIGGFGDGGELGMEGVGDGGSWGWRELGILERSHPGWQPVETV